LSFQHIVYLIILLNFQRSYLMKMADQVVALISHEHAQDLIWNRFDAEEDEDEVLDFDDDIESEVKEKTAEQEEDVSVRPGFRVSALIPS
jgi:hypothetical protein